MDGVWVGQFSKISDNKREDECIRIKQLIEAAFPDNTPLLSHLPNGRPIIDSDHNISISHTENWGAIYVTPTTCIPGIDIEMISNRASKVSCRFMQEMEYEFFLSLEEQERDLFATWLWSAKETAYKIFNPKDANLKAHFRIPQLAQLPFKKGKFTLPMVYSDEKIKERNFSIHTLYKENLIITCANYPSNQLPYSK